MTNLNKLYTLYNVHSHIEQENLSDLLENHLPNEYTQLVLDKLRDNTLTSQLVRTVKAGIRKNIAVFTAIVEVANDAKILDQKLREKLNPEIKKAV